MPENNSQPIDAEVVDEQPYTTSRKQSKRYYKSAAEYQQENGFGSLFDELMALLSNEDLEEIAEVVDDRRSHRRERLKNTILEQEQQAGDIQEAEAELTAVKAHLVSLDPELDKVFAAYDRQAEAAYNRGKRIAREEGVNLQELMNGSGGSRGDYDLEEDDPWEDEGQGSSILGINF